MKLGQKLVGLLLLIGLVPTLTVSAVAYITISNQLEKTTTDQLTSIAIKQEQKISSLLQRKQEEVTKLSNRFDFQVALAQYIASNREADKATIVSILEAKKIEVPDIQAITLANAQGKVLASTLAQQNGTTTVALPTQGITIQEDTRDGLNKLYVTTSVSVNKKDAATLAVVFRTDDIVAAIQDYTGLGETGETVITQNDAKGNAVSLFPLRFNTDAALKTKLNSLNLQNNSTYGVATDYRKQRVLTSSRSIGFANWTIGTKIDEKEAFEPIAQLRNSLITIVIISSVIITVIALYLGRFIARPIVTVARIAQQIGRGDLSAHVDIHRSDEIGTLADSVNSMGQSLKGFIGRVETQRNRLQIILDSTTESILAIDRSGTVIIANQATSELTQHSLTDIVGKQISGLFNWKHDDQPFEVPYEVPETSVYPNLQYVDSVGTVHFVKLIVARVASKTQDENAAQTIITIHDETKSRELEDMKIDFVSMAAHELRTPLAAIRGYLELIAFKTSRRPNPDTEVDGYIKQSLKSATELGGLINNLLDVTRIERGTLTLTMEKTDIAAAISDAVKDLSFSAKEKNIAVTYSGPPSGLQAIADHLAIREVINNLLTNAVKYTQPNGSVAISIEREDDMYLVHVKDTGLGIPRQALPHLFTKFYRVHGGLDSGSTGTGLGLFISKSIIERHNGSISVESEEGKGSTFTFSIPVLDEKRLAALQSEQSNEAVMRRHRGWVTKNIAR